MSDASGPIVAFIVIGAAVIVVLRLVKVLNGESGSYWTKPRGDAHDEEPEAQDDAPKKKRRKKKRPVASEEVVVANESSGQARAKHYAFAHQFLRSVTVANPAVWKGVRAAAATGAIDGILRRMWSELDEQPGQDSGAPPTGEALDDGVLVRMSVPEGMPECFWVAILEHEDGPRYFTLEKSLTSAMLCEWTDDAHRNLGPCEIDEATFVAAARSKVASPN